MAAANIVQATLDRLWTATANLDSLRRMRSGAVVLCLLLCPMGFADEAGRREIAKYGDIELSATIVPEQNSAVGASVAFTLGGQSVTMMKRSGLTNASAEQFVRGISVQQCRSNVPGRFILRASVLDADSGYYAIDQSKKMWGQYPSSLTTCPRLQAEPSSWHSMSSRPTKHGEAASH